jgi:hypothetical protein
MATLAPVNEQDLPTLGIFMEHADSWDAMGGRIAELMQELAASGAVVNSISHSFNPDDGRGHYTFILVSRVPGI